MSLSAGQLALSRSEKQHSELGLAILQPKTVLACQITDYTGTDMVSEFEFGNVTSGSYADVIPGQIVFVGSAAGERDLGICRVRKAWTSSVAYIDEKSDIAFADGVYLTVIDAIDVRPKHLVVTDEEVFMDVDIDYSDQHTNFDPVVIMGGNAVLDIESYPATIDFPDIADSWVFDDTIASYLTEASEGAISNGATTNPTLTVSSYPTNGYIRVSTTVTSTTGGKSMTGYRYVLVFDSNHRPITDFELESCGWERESGEWQARIVLNDSSDIALLRVGGLAMIYSKDYYGGSEGYIGLYADRENIWISGWIWQYKSVNDLEFQPREFEIHGAAFWMSRMASYPVGVEISSSAATAWTECAGLTVDKGIFHFLHYRSTVTMVMDFYPTDDTRYSPACESADGSLWGQLIDIGYSQILAKPVCDNNCKLFVKIPRNLIPSADRAAQSTLVWDLEDLDFERNVEIQYSQPRVSRVILNGIAVDVSGNGTAIFSLSPGHVPALIGEIFPAPNLLLEDQDQSNTLAGLIFSKENNPYENIPLILNANNRAFTGNPEEYGTTSDLDEYSGVIIPISIEYNHDPSTGKNEIEIVFEGETDETDAIYTDGDIPDGDGGFVSIGSLGRLPAIAPVSLPDFPTIPFPATIPTLVETDCADSIKNFFQLAWSKPWLLGGTNGYLISDAYFPCKIRSSALVPTYIDFAARVYGDAASNIIVYGMLGGSPVVTASLSIGIGRYAFRANFSVLSDTEVDGFRIVMTQGVGSVIESVTAGSVVSTGTAPAPNTQQVEVTGMTEGESYSIEASGGPWYWANFAPWNGWPNYGFALNASGYYGWDGNEQGSPPGFGTQLPAVAVYGEQISTYLGRVYLVKPAATVYFQTGVGGGSRADDIGSLDFICKTATILGRGLHIFGSVLNNVCAP